MWWQRPSQGWNQEPLLSRQQKKQAAWEWRTPIEKKRQTRPIKIVPVDNTSGDMTWLWSGAGACTGLLVRGWSLHWNLALRLEPALESCSEAGACTGILLWGWSLHWTLVRGWSLHWTLVRGWSLHWNLALGLEPALESCSGAGACTGLWLGAGACTGILLWGWSLHWNLALGLEPALDSG